MRVASSIGSIVLALSVSTPAVALDLADCMRITNPSHGGEARHQDVGAEWTAWIEWWSQEGVFTDLKVADCAGHRLLTARLREENIKDRQFDRRRAGQEAFERYIGRAPAFYALDDLAETLDGSARDIRVEEMTQEVCACAAAYPDTRGDLDAFALN
ncbi:MAG: hypothetical protein AAGE03_11160 [Pseudomonadota bacterium]